jgi:hypothetical protein
VAIIGSVFSSIYASRLGDALAGTPVPAEAVAIAEESVAGANAVAEQAGLTAGPQAQQLVGNAVNEAFVDGWHAGSWVSFAVVVVGAIVAWRFLPARATPAAPPVGEPERELATAA